MPNRVIWQVHMVSASTECSDQTLDRSRPSKKQQSLSLMFISSGVLNGFNGTIFCYGQTGSGKSFTMEGPDLYHEELKGLLPRMFTYLFKQIEKADQDVEFTIKCSFLEIYLEKIQDLLDPKKQNLQIKDQKGGRGIYVNDATEVYVTSQEEMFELMRAGAKNRTVAATRMNATSSRSHSIFILTVHQKNSKTDASKIGKVYFCDLAGSEKISKTEVTGVNLEEAKMINKSLSALGNVINALTESKTGQHIPYRDSKLTRILQESLGGNSQTCLVITCSLSAYNDRETLSTLRFGNRAKNIKNKVTQNAERSAKELLVLLGQAEGRISKITDLVKQIQLRLKSLVSEQPSDVQAAYNKIVEESKQIYSAKDFDFLLAQLKGEGSELLSKMAEEEIEEEKDSEEITMMSTSINSQNHADTAASITQQNDSNLFITPTSTINLDGKSAEQEGQPHATTQNAKEAAIKLYKQHVEMVKLKKELEKILEEKTELENEIKSRNEEIYQMNERLMMLEINSSMNNTGNGADRQQVNELQSKLDKVNDTNVRRANDIHKLKQCLDRLRCDLHMMFLNKKLNARDQSQAQIDDQHENSSTVENAFGESSMESEGRLNEQIHNTLEIIQRLEASLQSDIQANSDEIFSPDKDLMGYSKQQHARNKSMNQKADTTFQSDIDYINILPDIEVDDISFFKGSFVNGNGNPNQDKIEESYNTGQQTTEDKQAEIMLHQEESTQQQLRIGELEKLVETQQQELKLLASKSQIESQNPSEIYQTEAFEKDEKIKALKLDSDHKDKEIAILKEALVKEQKLKEKTILDLQNKLRIEREQVEKLMEGDADKRAVFEVENKCRIITDKNKTLMTEVINTRKEMDVKEVELEKAQKRALDLEKKLVLMKRQQEQQQVVNKMPMISSMMMPVQQNGQVQFGTFGDYYIGGAQPMNPIQVTVQNSAIQSDVPLFFNRKVIRPVKGGGKSTGPSSNPYSSNTAIQKHSAQTMNFNDFMNKQPHPSTKPKVLSGTMGNTNAPIIKPEMQKEFQASIGISNPNQMKQMHQKQQEALRKAKKQIYQQTYKEAKQMSQQVNLNETQNEDDSDDSEEDEEEEREEEKQQPANSRSRGLEVKKTDESYRRGKSMHASSHQEPQKGRTSLKNTLKSAFRNLF